MFLLIFALIILPNVAPARILCFFPTPSKSGVLMAQPLMVELAKRGHEVTFVSPFPLGKTIKNYRDVVIDVGNAGRELTKSVTSQEGKSPSKLTWLPKLIGLSANATNVTINHEIFQKIMKTEKFDLVIFGYFMNNFQLGLIEHFNCPSVILSTIPFLRFMEDHLGHPNNPEAVKSMLLRGNDAKRMTFFERVLNHFAYGMENLAHFYIEYKNQQYFDTNFPESKLGYSGVKSNISLVLVNQHLSEGWIRPLLPSVIEIGGLQIKQKPSPLPDDIKNWIESATEGVILVSFGSNYRSADFHQDKLKALMNSFRKIKQKIIWKYEDETLKNVPSNVLIKAWLPQDDILAHPKTKAFVSHCGISSYFEAMFHAVPIIAIPFAGDQPSNAKRAKDAGWALVVPFQELTEEKLDEAFVKILQNSSFHQNVMELSQHYRDRPLTAMENAVFWIEYVIRHNGAAHLKYPGVELNFIQARSIDVYAFFGVILYVFVKFIKFCVQKCCSIKKGVKTDKNHKSKKNN